MLPEQIDEANWIPPLGLDETLLDQPLAQLSGGQQQRMLIGLGFMLSRSFWLLDEPTSALDTQSKERVIELLQSRSDHTLLISTHDPLLIDQCDRVYKLENGHLREVN
jgi:ABC-type lipoprotein export system ATPase subunit